METYTGVKFHVKIEGSDLGNHPQLRELHYWSYLFTILGLAPSHSQGAYGNQSCRSSRGGFFITRAGMQATADYSVDDFVHVHDYNKATNQLTVTGAHDPSSESLLHYELYGSNPDIGAILHGHYLPFHLHSEALGIPRTQREYPYGTYELAEAACELAVRGSCFFLLHNHGFVAIGKDLATAAETTLNQMVNLLRLLQTTSGK